MEKEPSNGGDATAIPVNDYGTSLSTDIVAESEDLPAVDMKDAVASGDMVEINGAAFAAADATPEPAGVEKAAASDVLVEAAAAEGKDSHPAVASAEAHEPSEKEGGGTAATSQGALVVNNSATHTKGEAEEATRHVDDSNGKEVGVEPAQSTVEEQKEDVLQPPSASPSVVKSSAATGQKLSTEVDVSKKSIEQTSSNAAERALVSPTPFSSTKNVLPEPTPQKWLARKQQESSTSLLILSLPNDSLHAIASYLTPKEWSHFGQCSKGTNRISRDVFRRVRIHGFLCATEVVTAWKLGQHADAKELCALYVRSGVPIYPHSLGHSYRTLLWRLQAEAKHLEETAVNISSRNARLGAESDGTTIASNQATTQSGTGNVVGGENPVSDVSSNNDDGNQMPLVDPFYNNRDEARRRTGLVEEFGPFGLVGALPYSYLEEKAIFTMDMNDENESEVNRLTRSLRRRQMAFSRMEQINARLPAHARAIDDNDPHFMVGAQQIELPAPPAGQPARFGSLIIPNRDLSVLPRRQVTRSNSLSDVGYRAPKALLKVHRHLLDQHLLGRPSVYEQDADTNTPTVSLSVDFFHPYFSLRSRNHRRSLSTMTNAGNDALSTDGMLSGHLLPAWNIGSGPSPHRGAADADNPRMQFGNMGEPIGEEVSVSGGEAILEQATLAARRGMDDNGDTDDTDVESEQVADGALLRVALDGPNGDAASVQLLLPPAPSVMAPAAPLSSAISLSTTSPVRFGCDPFADQSRINILEKIDLDVYSASTSIPNREEGDHADRQLRRHLKTRFAVYQRRLEKYLSNCDSEGFEECILDFWDEFLPQTASVHYYDRQTAVPRISCLQKFLTRPCPKAVGIVQCEIERIKVGSKKKGVNVKGRFFPTYEYRLFIRHRHADASLDISTEPDEKKPRRDTVLMMAKNKGRKNVESNLAPKKGSNNYYLHLPKQEDVEAHYKSVNGVDSEDMPTPNGASLIGLAESSSVLLGRLQSNFIGTEFQIFTPRVVKQAPKLKPIASRSSTMQMIASGTLSDDDVLAENEASVDPALSPSARRLGRFRRLSLIGRGSGHGDHRESITEDELVDPLGGPLPSGFALRRTRSSGDIIPGRKSRQSRRVSAADAVEIQTDEPQQPQRPSFTEEEDGAVTYTANLLGSRPRIMDVCIPKVTTDGPGTEWKRYLDNCDDREVASSVNKMLNHLKQLQQRSEGEEVGRGNHANAEAQQEGTGEGASSERQLVSNHYSPPSDFGLLALQNRPPWWNVELGSFVLNFGGRVSVASVKNFQLCDSNDQDYIMLQFGRISGRHSFTMDFQHPLTAVQAFGIAISSLQSKISFG